MRDDAVSSVVAAVLLFGLMTTAAALWSVNTLPVWIMENEAEHAATMQGDLNSISAGLLVLSGSNDAGPVQRTIDLAAPKVALLQSVVLPGTVTIAEDVRIQANLGGTTLHYSDGNVLGDPSAFVTGATYADVSDIRALRIGLQSDVNDDEGAGIEIEATGPGGTVTGTLWHYGLDFATACDDVADIRFEVGGTSKVILCGVAPTLGDHFLFDPMASEYGFKSALGTIGRPMDVTISAVSDNGGSHDATPIMGMVWQDEDGALNTVGTGTPSSYALDLASNSLAVRLAHQEFPQQELRMEAGGITITQAPDMVVAEAPGLVLADLGTAQYLSWTMVAFTGPEASVSGNTRATILVGHTTTSDALIEANGGTISLTTPTADAWASFFNSRINVAGMSGASASSDGSTMTLSLDPGTWMLNLRVIEASISMS